MGPANPRKAITRMIHKYLTPVDLTPVRPPAAAIRAIATRRVLVAMAATMAIMAGCLVTVTALGASDAAAATRSSTQIGPSGEGEPSPAQPSAAMTPEELSTEPVLEWTEIDPDFDDLLAFESLDSGRVIAWVWGTGDGSAMDDIRVVYTDNGTDWTELPLPDEIGTGEVVNSGDRWLAYGWAYDFDESQELVERVFLSDDRGATWTELNISVPPDSPQEVSSCERFLYVDSASITDDGIVLDLSGYRYSEELAQLCEDVAPMRLRWSNGTTVQLPAGPEISIDDMPALDGYLWPSWSADGTDWRWQSLADAFGLTEGEQWVEFGMGRDFVIARVETLTVPTPTELASASTEGPCAGIYSSYAEAPPPRWFIARIP